MNNILNIPISFKFFIIWISFWFLTKSLKIDAGKIIIDKFIYTISILPFTIPNFSIDGINTDDITIADNPPNTKQNS